MIKNTSPKENFLFCIDSNYNFQCYLSICSLLNNSEEALNIFIIHNQPKSFQPYKELLISKNQDININIKKFKNSNVNFQKFFNVDNKHISIATMYRLYLEYYIDTSIEKILYLDADVFAINRFSGAVNETFRKLINSSYVLGAFDVVNYNKGTKLKPYFNAGVLFIDLKKWREQNITKKLLEEYDLNPNYKYHDQDILNNVFKDSFLNIDEKLNLHISLEDNAIKKFRKKIKENSVLIHYVGATKPWNYEGFLKLNAFLYHELIKHNNNGILNLPKKSKKFILKFIFLNISKILFSKFVIYYFSNLINQLKNKKSLK